VFYSDSGATAVEISLKIAYQYFQNKGLKGRTKFIALENSYHGDTVGSVSVGGIGLFHSIFKSLLFETYFVPSPHPYRFKNLTTENAESTEIDECARYSLTKIEELLKTKRTEIAAVIVEPLVQGAAGMALVPAEAVAAVARAAAAHDVLVIHDEVATGFGRTGTLFATEQCGTQPDLMVLGKGITGGYLPLSATVASERVWSAFLGPDLSERTFYHGHSYSGNALAAAVALRHLQLIDEWDVLANVTDRSAQLRSALADRVAPLAAVAHVRQQGLMVGIELAPPADGLRWGRRVSAGCVDRRVLIRPLGDVIVLMPPLTTTEAEIDRIVTTVAEAIAEVAGA